MEVKFYNTLERKIMPFSSVKDGKVGMYTCGPTVYNFAHIGNFRAYTFEDILRRTLEFFGYNGPTASSRPAMSPKPWRS